MRTKSVHRAVYGDFQTPIELATRVCELIRGAPFTPASIIEPSCGEGNFLSAALEIFHEAKSIIGVELNSKYVSQARQRIASVPEDIRPTIVEGNFFNIEWNSLLVGCPDPVLILGNPPWVTNSEIGNLNGNNLPLKQNVNNLRGIDARTGKSNFDISEWMIRKYLEWIIGRDATIGILCKTAVARKILTHIWERKLPFSAAEIFEIDAARYFGATVEACLFVIQSRAGSEALCRKYAGLSRESLSHIFGFKDGLLISDMDKWTTVRHLLGRSQYHWRSGIKHDCSAVMEFTTSEKGYRNGAGEYADIESDLLFPLLKSSDLTNGNHLQPTRRMLVTQKTVNEDTTIIESRFPKTWEYLLRCGEALDRRKSSIYRSRPRFSIFGVGEYAFLPWKVAISALYKKLRFVMVGLHDDRPIVLDDTCYYVACESREEAELLCGLLNSDRAKLFFESLIFWDNKRAINAGILSRLDLRGLASDLGKEGEFIMHVNNHRRMKHVMNSSMKQDRLSLE